MYTLKPIYFNQQNSKPKMNAKKKIEKINFYSILFAICVVFVRLAKFYTKKSRCTFFFGFRIFNQQLHD
jgi:hypothetical protein